MKSLSCLSFLPQNKEMAGDMHALASVRLAGQAVFLDYRHFKGKRLLHLSQIEGERKSACALCPKVLNLEFSW